jgi:hypothetical protein
MKKIDIFKTRKLKFRMTTFDRLTTELETGIWGVVGFPSLKIMDSSEAMRITEEIYQEWENLRKEKPYDDPKNHIFSHRGNVIYPDGQLDVLLCSLKNIEPHNLYLYPENPDYKNLLSLLANGALNSSGLTNILSELGYSSNNEELVGFIEEHYENIQERISMNVFKTNTDASLKGINISDKFDIGYVIDSSLKVLISYNDDHMNQGVIIEPKIDPKHIIGILLNSSRIEKLKNEKYLVPEKPFEKLATVHLATLRNFIDWFGTKGVNKNIYIKLVEFIKNIPESFFYLDANSKMDDVFSSDELDILNNVAKDFLTESGTLKNGQTYYECILELCKKYNLPLYSSDGAILQLS